MSKHILFVDGDELFVELLRDTLFVGFVLLDISFDDFYEVLRQG